MTTISLLFFLASVLALSSLFLCVSGHAPLRAEAEYNANSFSGADVQGFESIYQKMSHFFGGYLGGQTHRRELITVGPAVEAPAGVNAAAPTDRVKMIDFHVEIIGLSHIIAREKGNNYKAHRRELYSTASASGEVIRGSLEDFLNLGLGGNDQYDAAGVVRVGRRGAFRPPKRPRNKHVTSTEA